MSASESTATAAAPELAQRPGIVVVVAHQRGHVEGDAEPRLAVGEQLLEAPVGLLGAAEAGEHADRPGSAAVAAGVDAAREGVLARVAEVGAIVEAVVGQVGGAVQPPDRPRGDRHEGAGPLLPGGLDARLPVGPLGPQPRQLRRLVLPLAIGHRPSVSAHKYCSQVYGVAVARPRRALASARRPARRRPESSREESPMPEKRPALTLALDGIPLSEHADILREARDLGYRDLLVLRGRRPRRLHAARAGRDGRPGDAPGDRHRQRLQPRPRDPGHARLRPQRTRPRPLQPRHRHGLPRPPSSVGTASPTGSSRRAWRST